MLIITHRWEYGESDEPCVNPSVMGISTQETLQRRRVVYGQEDQNERWLQYHCLLVCKVDFVFFDPLKPYTFDKHAAPTISFGVVQDLINYYCKQRQVACDFHSFYQSAKLIVSRAANGLDIL